MICSSVSGLQRLSRASLHLLAEARLVQQLGERRGVDAAVAAVLDENDDDHLRIVSRRKRGEPRVVAVLERQPSVFTHRAAR